MDLQKKLIQRSRPAFLAKILQTMGTPGINAEASQSRRSPQAIFSLRGLARRKATSPEFSAVFSLFFIMPSKNKVLEGHMIDICTIFGAR